MTLNKLTLDNDKETDVTNMTENKTAQAIEILENYIEKNYADDCEIYRNYSGRGMFGSECIGVDFESRYSEHEDAIRGLAAEHGWGATQQDSMGLGFILYWPRLEEVDDE